jgi:hypothetical protein
MGLSSADKLGSIIGNIAKEQSKIADNISSDEPDAALFLTSDETIEITGELIVNKFTYATNSFIIDHPVYGEIDSSSLLLDGGYLGQNLTIGLQSFYNLDAGDGVGTDEVLDQHGSNNGTASGYTTNDGTVSGGVTINETTGAMVFDGVDGRVDTGIRPDLSSGDKTFVVDFVYDDSYSVIFTNLNRAHFSSGHFKGFNIYIEGSGTLRFSIGDGTNNIRGINIGSVTQGEEYNLVVTFSGDTVTTYLNGIQTYTTTNSIISGSDDGQHNIYLGRFSTTTQNPNGWPLEGSISRFLYFENILPQSKINQIYNAGKDSYSPVGDGLVAQYSGRDFEGSAAAPTTILDKNYLVQGPNDNYPVAWNFQGDKEQHIELDDLIPLDPLSVTIADWVRVDDPSTLTTIGGFISAQYTTSATRRGQWLFGVNSNMQAQVRYFPSPSSSVNSAVLSDPLNQHEYYRIVFTNNGGVGKLYVNGVLVDSNENMTSMNEVWSGGTNTHGIDWIGRARAGSSYARLTGAMCAPLFVNRPWSPEEVAADWNNGEGLAYPLNYEQDEILLERIY